MVFRYSEEIEKGERRALSYLTPKGLGLEEAKRVKDIILDILDECGPVVESYPIWHPLVSHHHDCRSPRNYPSRESGYNGLDHTIYFRNGFVTCPYHNADDVLRSVENLETDYQIAEIEAREINVELYNTGTKPVLVKCNWKRPIQITGFVPKNIAVPLLLEKEVPCWRTAEVGETWESMKPYIMGSPHGSRSSLFVDQEAGKALKKVWEAITYTGMYGPIKV